MPLTSEDTVERTIELEDFWDDLLAFIEEGRVVPVVGPELPSVVINGCELPLYRVLAERLLQKNGLQGWQPGSSPPDAGDKIILRKHLELNDAVSALSQRGRRIGDLYRPINDLLRNLLGAQPAIPRALRDLGLIADFRLFVTTTFDDLLARAIESTYADAAAPADQIAYSPNLPGNQAHDLPIITPKDYRAVFYLFGKHRRHRFSRSMTRMCLNSFIACKPSRGRALSACSPSFGDATCC